MLLRDVRSSCGRRAAACRGAVAWFGVAWLALGAPATLAQGEVPDAGAAPETAPDLWDTFVYERPAPTYRLRLAIEEVLVLGVTMTGYLIQDPAPPEPGVPAVTPWDK